MRVFKITGGEGETEDLLDHCCFEQYLDPEDESTLEQIADDGDLDTAELLWGLKWGMNSRSKPTAPHSTVNIGENPSLAQAANEKGWRTEIFCSLTNGR